MDPTTLGALGSILIVAAFILVLFDVVDGFWGISFAVLLGLAGAACLVILGVTEPHEPNAPVPPPSVTVQQATDEVRHEGYTVLDTRTIDGGVAVTVRDPSDGRTTCVVVTTGGTGYWNPDDFQDSQCNNP